MEQLQPCRKALVVRLAPTVVAVLGLVTVRFCSCIVHMSFMLYLCSVDVHSRLHWFALAVAGCSRNALQLINVHYEIEVYSGICASLCPLVVMYAELLVSRLA